MNILITAAGRRNYLVRYFKQAVPGGSRVLVADASPTAAALEEADEAFTLPHAADPSFVDELLELCLRESVDAVLSLNDVELPILAANRDRLLDVGTTPIISSRRVIDVCFDKWASHELVSSSGMNSPVTVRTLTEAKDALESGRLSFPVVVKRRFGSASTDLEVAYDTDQLEWSYRLVEAKAISGHLPDSAEESLVLVQERISGTEFGLDVLNDLDGNYVATVVKKKLSMRAGETDIAVTCRHEELERVGEMLGRRLGHVGNLDVDVLMGEESPYVIDLNPRFGGGYPFSHVAGANFPAAIIAWLEGKPAPGEALEVSPDVMAAKADWPVVLSPKAVRESRAGIGC